MVLKIIDISKKYQDHLVLDDISFNVENEIISLIGPSGAGKTTLLKIISGIEKQDSGKVLLDNNEITNSSASILIQDQELIPHLNVFNNISFIIENIKYDNPNINISKAINDEINILKELNIKFPNNRKEKKELIEKLIVEKNITPTSINLYIKYKNNLDKLLHKLNILNEKLSKLDKRKLTRFEIEKSVIEVSRITKVTNLLFKKPFFLSLGEKQRVKLSLALIKKPKVLLLDEPTGNLDPLLKQEISDNLLLVHKELNIPIIYVTHSFEEAKYISNKIAILNNGVLEQYDNPNNLINNPKSRFICSLSSYSKDNIFKPTIKNEKIYFDDIFIKNIENEKEPLLYISPDSFTLDEKGKEYEIISIDIENNTLTLKSDSSLNNRFKIRIPINFSSLTKKVKLSIDKSKIIVLEK